MVSHQPPDFVRLIGEVARELRARDLPFMLIGGQAVLLHGEARLTQDVDITLGISPDRDWVYLGKWADQFATIPGREDLPRQFEAFRVEFAKD